MTDSTSTDWKLERACTIAERLRAERDALAEALRYAVQFSDVDINPTIRKRLSIALAKVEA